MTPSRLVDRFAGLHVLVLGEAMLDSYLEGASSRLCPEAPAPVVAVTERRDFPGGAANTAVNVGALGARVSFLSVVGDDAEAASLRHCLEARGVAADRLVVEAGRRAVAKKPGCAARQIPARDGTGA